MRTIQGVRAGWLVAALVGCMLVGGAARADVATERPGSILIFPKVVRDGTRDTIIQITNTGNSTNFVRCFYLNGAAGRDGEPLCSEIDFDLVLTRQQPTHWNVSTGRQVNPNDAFGASGAGLDPGLVPGVGVGFTGALVCVEVDPTNPGVPFRQNKLKGEALLGEESKYNAIAIPQGSGALTAPANRLDLDDVEYAACPATQRLNFIPDGATDPVIEAFGNGGRCVGGSNNGGPCNSVAQCPGVGASCATGQSSVVTNLTVVPCDLDFQNGVNSGATLFFDVRDEFEVTFSGSRSVGCWGSFNIGGVQNGALRSGLLSGGAINTQYATARITISAGSPVVGVAESFHADSIGNIGAAAANLHMEGSSPGAQIRLSDR